MILVRPFPIPKFAVFGLHTAGVYVLALRVEPWLVGRWYAWVMPVLQIRSRTPVGDWWMQHFEIVTLIPALIVGYITTRQSFPYAKWAWLLPTAVLVYKMARLDIPHSIIPEASAHLSALAYFFEIERWSPSVAHPFEMRGDPIRLVAQMLFTGPFYAGMAYSIGAVVAELTGRKDSAARTNAEEEQTFSTVGGAL
jgi:hypothetical protein